MKVSIIVPCYKVEKYLHTCIESVLNQSYADWELILVDDGSPDRSGEICDEFSKIDNRICVIHKQNGGLSDARNAGLNVMTGDYVTFLDSDDFWHHDYLKVLMTFILSRGAEIAQCNFVRGIETHYPQINIQATVLQYDNHTIFTKQAAKIIMCGKIYKASLFDNIRMPVGKIHEDDWTTWKLYYKAKTIVVTSQPLYYYTENPNSIMGRNKNKPDFTYWGAYNERINFFIATGEIDLEHTSRMQFCKSLTLLYGNKMLTAEERGKVKALFEESWEIIKYSNIVPVMLKIVFGAFSIFPLLISKVLSVK